MGLLAVELICATFAVVFSLILRDLEWRVGLDTLEHLVLVPQHPHPLSVTPDIGPVSLFPLRWEAGQDPLGDAEPAAATTEADNALRVRHDVLSNGAVYVVTGSSSGIGLATALRLEALLGPRFRHRVVYAVRGVAKTRELLGKLGRGAAPNGTEQGASVLPLDLSSLRSVREFGAELLPAKLAELASLGQRPLKVVLVNNAGQAWLAEKVLTEDGLESQFQSNFLGHYLLTRLLLAQGLLLRTVHVSSLAHAFGVLHGHSPDHRGELGKTFSKWTYMDTKFMNNLLSNYLGRELGMPSVAVNPGLVHTSVLRHQPSSKKVLELLLPSQYLGPVAERGEPGLFASLHHRVARMFYLTADESANTLLYSIFNVNLNGYTAAGANASVLDAYVVDMRLVPQVPRALDTEAQEHLWSTAEMYVRSWLDAPAAASD